MQAEWVAASVRARLIARHRLGRVTARDLAHLPTWDAAVDLLAGSAYGQHLSSRPSLDEAQYTVAAEALWNLRILSGWVPHTAIELLRALAAGFEIANIEGHLLSLSGATAPPPLPLGPLGGAWKRVRDATTPTAVREVLTASVWGDPGSDRAELMAPVLHLRWAARLASGVPDAGSWAAGMAALVLARERFVTERPLGPWATAAPPQLGTTWRPARSLAEFRDLVSRQAAWVLADVEEPDDLWLAEARWWQRVEADALHALAGSQPGPGVVAASAALLLVDVWRTHAALTAVAGGVHAREAFDAAA